MKILIVNQPLNNRGDESAHKGLLRTICREMPQCKITVLFVNGNPDSINQFNVHLPNVEYINLKAVKGFSRVAKIGLRYDMRWLWCLHPTISRVIRLYRNYDLVVCAPGGICMGGFQNWGHLFFLQVAKHLGKKLAYYGRSFGPFPVATSSNRKFKELSLEMLNYFSFLSIRDKKTETLARELNISYVSTVDSAFLDSPKVEIPKEIQSMIGTDPYMVFVPNLLIWHYAYKGKVSKETILSFYSQLTDCITKHYPSYKIVMLPQTFNNGIGDDINLFREIEAIKKDSRIVVVPDRYSSDIQQTIISKAKFLVGARYHSVVFAINNNTPFVALSYEHKISGLLATLNKEYCMIDITKTFVNPTSIKNTIALFDDKLQTLSDDKEAQAKAKNKARVCMNEFVGFCKLPQK